MIRSNIHCTVLAKSSNSWVLLTQQKSVHYNQVWGKDRSKDRKVNSTCTNAMNCRSCAGPWTPFYTDHQHIAFLFWYLFSISNMLKFWQNLSKLINQKVYIPDPGNIYQKNLLLRLPTSVLSHSPTRFSIFFLHGFSCFTATDTCKRPGVTK